ncbi:unnamed protein product [Rhizophagus irregularis]|nr:unnamed protein product [Rhizophagus irregularis]
MGLPLYNSLLKLGLISIWSLRNKYRGVRNSTNVSYIDDWSTVKSIRHGCSNHRNRYIDKVSLPASANKLPAYEAVHTMLRTLEYRLSKLTDYCTKLKVEHARLRRNAITCIKKTSSIFKQLSEFIPPKKVKNLIFYVLLGLEHLFIWALGFF